MAMSASFGSTITRSFSSGSMISTRIGPTEMSIRSSSGFEVRMMRWVPSFVTARTRRSCPGWGTARARRSRSTRRMTGAG